MTSRVAPLALFLAGGLVSLTLLGNVGFVWAVCDIATERPRPRPLRRREAAGYVC